MEKISGDLKNLSLQHKQKEIVAAFGDLPNTEERFRYLIGLGRRYPAFEAAWKTDERLLPGCVSRLWIMPEFREGRCWFAMDAEAAISKGIAALLCGFYDGDTPANIAATEPEFVVEIGIASLLSPNRSNALTNLRHRIKEFAEQCLKDDNICRI